MQHDNKLPQGASEDKPKTTQTGVRVPADLWEAVRIEAIRRGSTAQQLVVDALRKLLGDEKAA